MFENVSSPKVDRKGFETDPFGYSASARLKWGLAQTMAGFDVDISKPATTEELKSPILWLSQAHALAQSAIILTKNNPDLTVLPGSMKAACDSQYCGVVLMLVGYSLEISLKAIIIMRCGIDEFIQREKKLRHHRLEDLANFMPNLSKKDRAILRGLTHFVYWAGRYPDPGLENVEKLEEIHNLAEGHQITAKELFDLAGRVMGYANVIANEQ